ncbi:MAG: hypothetical protein KC912_03450 [Proteobacteria bacterium]|nr:hypothetical protein [Pseudomonadota bacterium]
MDWHRDNDARISTLPTHWGGGCVTAWRVRGGWMLDAPGLDLFIRNPKLKTWTRAKGVIEATLRAHYKGPAVLHRTPSWS